MGCTNSSAVRETNKNSPYHAGYHFQPREPQPAPLENLVSAPSGVEAKSGGTPATSGVGLLTVDAVDRTNGKNGRGPPVVEQKTGSSAANPRADARASLLLTAREKKEQLNTKYELAAFHLLSAIDGKKQRTPRPGKLAQLFATMHYKNQQRLKLLAMSGLLLTCFETPTWCLNSDGDPTELCESNLYPSYHMPYLPRAWDHVVELCFLSLMAADTLCILYANGSKYDCGRLVLLILNGIDMFFYGTMPDSWPRSAAYIRLGYVFTYLPDVQTGINLVISTLPAIGKILVLLGAYLAFFAWLGVILFPADSAEGQAYFPDLAGGMWQLLILITTANYPDVMMPAYSANRGAFIFFLAFLLFGFFFLVNLLTAAVFTCYQTHETEQIQEAEAMRDENLEIAYSYLVGHDEEISTETMLDFFQVMNSFQLTAYISDEDALDMLEKLNADGEGGISMVEWRELFQVLEHRFETYAPDPYLEIFFPHLKTDKFWLFMKWFSHHPCFDGFIDIVLVFSVFVTAAETWESIMGLPLNMSSMKKYAALDTLFVVIFFFEVTAKALTEGFWKYMKEVKHRFDFITTMAMTVTAFIGGDPVLAKYVALLRIFRLVRLLLHVKAYETIAATFGQMLPEAAKVTKVLICFMYLFSVSGVQLFGGLISCDKSSPYYSEVCDPNSDNAYAQGGYSANNFNDIPSAMVTLFELLIVNNWFVISDGFTATFGFTSRIYFVVFYIVGIVVVLNIVVASVLNTYSAIEEEREKKEMQQQISSGSRNEKDQEEDAKNWLTEQVKSGRCSWRDVKAVIEGSS